MFRAAAIVVLLGVAAACVMHSLIVRRRRKPPVSAGGRRQPSSEGGGLPALRRFTRFERLLLWVLAGSFLALALTGLTPRAFFGEDLLGWWLMAHVTFGGVFAVALMLAVVRWAGDACFAPRDTEGLFRCPFSTDDVPAGRLDAWEKLFFWFGAAGGVTAIVTVMLEMLEWLGPDGIEILAEVHRWSGLVLTGAGVAFAYRTALVKGGRLGGLIGGDVHLAWARRYHGLWCEQMEGSDRA